MPPLTAYRVYGKTLHGQRSCVKKRTAEVPFIDGLAAGRDVWRPCLWCAGALTVAALHGAGDPAPTIVSVRPLPDDADSWRHEQQPTQLDFHAELTTGLELTPAGDPGGLTPISYGPMPAVTAAVLGAQFAVHRLPGDAVPTPATVALFTALVHAEPVDLRTLDDPADWIAGRWTVACAILAPVLTTALAA